MQWLQTQSNLAIIMFGVIVILGLATLGYWLLKQWRPSKNLPKIGVRIQFAWVLTIIFLGAISTTTRVLLLFIVLLAFLAFKEFLSITPTRRADRRVLFWAYLAIPIQFYFIWQGWYGAFISFVPLYALIFLPLIMVLVGETEGFLKASSTLSWGLVTTVFALGHLAYLLVLPISGNPGSGGGGLFLFVVILTQLNDVAQFLFGKLFYQPILRLKVSQTRTWASLVGSLGTSMLISWLIAVRLTPLSQGEALVMGVVLAVAGFVGYITMSAIKSDLQLPDRGTMTPGQGGVLNRIDSLIYSAPLFFHLLIYWHY